MWKVDLHCHSRYSRDCQSDPKKLIETARRCGLDKIAITDHNNLHGARVIYDMAPDLVIIGEEIATISGEVIAYFVTSEVPRGLMLLETIQRLRDQGAVISIPHPLDRMRGSAVGYANLVAVIDLVDAVEVWNARCIQVEDNVRARTIAQQYSKLVTAGSDAHTLGEVGAAYVQVQPFTNAQEMRVSLAAAQVIGRISPPWVHLASTWAKWQRRIAGRQG
jgi:predicted metal-dependent phosphoesterase TrpH